MHSCGMGNVRNGVKGSPASTSRSAAAQAGGMSARRSKQTEQSLGAAPRRRCSALSSPAHLAASGQGLAALLTSAALSSSVSSASLAATSATVPSSAAAGSATSSPQCAAKAAMCAPWRSMSVAAMRVATSEVTRSACAAPSPPSTPRAAGERSSAAATAAWCRSSVEAGPYCATCSAREQTE